MKRLITVGATMLLGSALAAPLEAQKELEVKEAIATFIEKDPDMKEWFSSSYGYVVFPNVGKAGLGIGGAHGNGLVYEDRKLVGKSELKAVTVGLQLGGQKFEYESID